MGFLGGIVRSVSRAVSSVSSFASKAMNFLKTPASSLMKPLQGLVDKVTSKLPFGLDKLVKPFAEKFLKKAEGFLQGGPLGALGNILSKIPSTSKLGEALKNIDGVIQGGVKSMPAEAKSNLFQMFAKAQAGLVA